MSLHKAKVSILSLIIGPPTIETFLQCMWSNGSSLYWDALSQRWEQYYMSGRALPEPWPYTGPPMIPHLKALCVDIYIRLSIIIYIIIDDDTMHYNRLSSAAFAVKKIRSLTDVETARLVYFSYFHSIMSYGILLWGIQPILVLQKRAIRAIYNLGPKASLRQKF